MRAVGGAICAPKRCSRSSVRGQSSRNVVALAACRRAPITRSRRRGAIGGRGQCQQPGNGAARQHVQRRHRNFGAHGMCHQVNGAVRGGVVQDAQHATQLATRDPCTARGLPDRSAGVPAKAKRQPFVGIAHAEPHLPQPSPVAAQQCAVRAMVGQVGVVAVSVDHHDDRTGAAGGGYQGRAQGRVGEVQTGAVGGGVHSEDGQERLLATFRCCWRSSRQSM